MRRAAKTDDNHARCVSVLRANGWSVLSLAAHGRGVLDLLVARDRFTCLLELKDGAKPASKRRLTKDQQAFVRQWKGAWAVVIKAEEAPQIAENLRSDYFWDCRNEPLQFIGSD